MLDRQSAQSTAVLETLLIVSPLRLVLELDFGLIGQGL